MNTTLLIESLDLDDLQNLANRLVMCFPSRLTIGLVGTLGAGKTTLVQAISSAMGVDRSDVTSPTFTLLQSHCAGGQTLHHLDAYRVADEDEFLELGVEELFDQEQAWTLIEWADRVEGVMPDNVLWLEIQIESHPDRRTVEFRTSDHELSQVLKTALREMMPKG
ncbi:tRNA (adenosine(37)-N6)-threonylcarbamoyltransferase complex ATPase subunit type 1 TsaE [bacterium]|nr:tRNA (adenosine(37)-N6)-threonylcarbamoyltransferase complex ATPase subunit type 1 TsaE [Rubripirellula sp.]MDA7875117.1 tRNA (adenosine(37)-N6)-threonylcarbamoyltransferase complex ATPase subunit type 1 TsaE [Rhodopirellula sp.]MDA7878294.1 tRNA (adenosine(37)-N6)-threonylcarbamoyltransferase complex ATPase subunit type 1 TsaE [bacterium]MDB4621614.1 tRNA (adenosine(37)-N6)-threonylcarbamoyltransferase complex ATPase subunit type 1 TsaE [Rubripirellula sp.]